MNKKKGFTLIELLAVIVVLAIIVLIATPIVMNTIKNVQKGAAERSSDNYIDAVETAVATERLSGNILSGEYIIQADGNLCPTSGCGESDKDKIIIEANGNKPTSGIVTISDGRVTTGSIMTIGNYGVGYDDTVKRYTATKLETYNNGEVVYFNVTTGMKCTSSDYIETQSNTGVKEGCMKFYVFNDNGGVTLNLILDHNTTAIVAWNLSGISASGPKEVLEQLKTDTKSWHGTITQANYNIDQTDQISNAKYIVDYNGYKARLITAQEVAQITENKSWNEKTADSLFYLDTNKRDESSTCKIENTTRCMYGWLYDRTHTDCTTYGCKNNSDLTTYGYWTISSRADYSDRAWRVDCYARLSSDHVDYPRTYGVRPVITVSKIQLR